MILANFFVVFVQSIKISFFASFERDKNRIDLQVLDGIATIGQTPVKYLSGTSISNAPPHALIALSDLIDLVGYFSWI